MNIKEFLESKGYKMWSKDSDSISTKSFFQKRWEGESPLCKTNEAIYINVNHYIFHMNAENGGGLEIELCHGREDDVWCKLKLYSITPQSLVEKLEDYEYTLLEMWETFYGEEG